MKINLIVILLLGAALLLGLWWVNDTVEGTPDQAARISLSDDAQYLLAVTWQPAFCETAPNRPECRSQRSGRFDTRNFSLHGLWPQPYGNFYCDVPQSVEQLDRSGNWHALPKLELTAALRRELEIKMPGYRSGLHRHEWIKHGTCMPGFTPQSYFRLSLDLLDEFNRSAFVNRFRERVGDAWEARDLRRAFERSFGPGSGARLLIECSQDNRRRLLRELRLSISGSAGENQPLAVLLSNGETVPRSCPRGVVDPVGLQ